MIVSIAPFALLLLSIAVLPLVKPHWWESNKNKAIVAAIFGAPVAILFAFQNMGKLVHVGLDYLAFIALLGSLFVISGGIHIRGSFAGLPITNTLILAIGGLLANFIGTTGASMLLIRPLIRANQKRRHKAHVIVFFIFIVSNCAGALTPLGDPPLFLGFLNGIPFDWTFQLFYPWLLVVGLLLVTFNIFDQYKFNKEDLETRGSLVEGVSKGHRKIHVEGGRNLLFLLGVIGAILTAGYWVYPNYGDTASKLFQIVFMAGLAAASYKTTWPGIRAQNDFTFHPIVEVAVLFAGIFAAMIPALEILETRGRELGLEQSWQYFWATGALSGFLDNAPTYLTFSSLAKSVLGISSEGLGELVKTAAGNELLRAVACGAVFMGAATYIGNGPNFMVKAIAEQSQIKMPGFFGYMIWSGVFLIPILVLATFVFFA
jgi:Na+/H+ antiporter NhaD/arsenite permease-like protein